MIPGWKMNQQRCKKHGLWRCPNKVFLCVCMCVTNVLTSILTVHA